MSTPAANKAGGNTPPRPSQAGLFLLVKPYKGLVATLAALTILANALNLVVPKLIARAIDNYQQPNFALGPLIARFLLVCVSAFLLTYLQSLVQTYASERVAKDLRTRLAAKLATQTYSFVEQITPANLRCAPDGFLLTGPNTSCTIEVPASLRSEYRSRSARNAVRVPFGMPSGATAWGDN